MPLFFFLALGLYLGGNAYVFIRGGQALSMLPASMNIVLGILFWTCALSMATFVLFRSTLLPPLAGKIISYIATGWMLFILYMILLLLIIDMLKLVHVTIPHAFFISIGIVFSLFVYGYIHYMHPATHVIDIHINKPLTSYKQLKIVGISDLHIGYATNKQLLARYVGLINEQKADLVLIGGDLIDNNVGPVAGQHMEEELKKIHAPMGIYMVPGNHEYISGIEATEKFIRQTPIHFLKDTVVTLEGGIQIVGRDDRANPARKSLDAVMQGVNLQKPVILLDHQPYHLGETVEAGVDLQFSGHTHRGQIWPISWLVDRMFELSAGYRKTGNTHFYVSTGLSLWGPPFRIGTDSELVVFNVTFDNP